MTDDLRHRNKCGTLGIFILHVVLLGKVGAITVKSPMIKAKHQLFRRNPDPLQAISEYIHKLPPNTTKNALTKGTLQFRCNKGVH